MARISFGEFAKLVGVSRPAIYAAAKTGRLTSYTDDNDTKFLIEEDALIEWERNSLKNARDETKGVSDSELKKKLEEDSKEKKENSNIPALNDSRAIREAFRARIEKLRYEELTNKLVDVEKAQREYYEMARKVRDCMTAIPDRISAQLAAETNQFKVHKKLMDEIRIALRSLIEEEELKQNG